MKLPITTPRRYELAVLHHVPVIYNLVKQVYGTRGSSSNLLENIPTTTGFDMIRGWAAHVAQRAVALWLENGATASTPYPAVDIMHVPNAHCEVIASIMHTKIYNRRIREIAGMRVVAQLHKVPLFASLDPGLLRVPYSALTESEQAAVDQYRVDYAQYKSGARMPMPHPPRGSVSPVEHYRQVVEALHYQAGYHTGQYVINIVTSSTFHASEVALDDQIDASTASEQYPYREVPAPGYGYQYVMSDAPPQRLTPQPVAYSLKPGAAEVGMMVLPITLTRPDDFTQQEA